MSPRNIEQNSKFNKVLSDEKSYIFGYFETKISQETLIKLVENAILNIF